MHRGRCFVGHFSVSVEEIQLYEILLIYFSRILTIGQEEEQTRICMAGVQGMRPA